MTTFDTLTTTPTQQRKTRTAGALVAELLIRFNDYREMRKANRARPFYHNHKAENLERAHRDITRLWQRQF